MAVPDGQWPDPSVEVSEPTAVRETDGAVLVLSGAQVLKFLKPVTVGQWDLGEVTERRVGCQHEIEVNSRLAGDVYLGVGSVAVPDVFLHPSEPCVVMRRLPEQRQLAYMLDHGMTVDEQLVSIAVRLAAFHTAAQRGPAISVDAASVALRLRWAETLDGLQRFVGRLVDPATFNDVRLLAERWLAGRDPLMTERIGDIVDGHGDLRADAVFCLDDGPRILGAAWDERRRRVDVASDVAALVLDLRRRGRAREADMFLIAYEGASGEVLPRSMVEHEVAYWAARRALAACDRWERHLRLADEEVDMARRLLELALLTLQAARTRLILIGGLPGSGATSLAEGLAMANDWLLLSADAIRRELARLPGGRHASAAEGLYGPRWTAATYEELLRRAAAELGRGCTVVADASWMSSRWRAAASDVALATASELVPLHCVTDAATARSRLVARWSDDDGLYGPDATIADVLAERFDDWPEATVLDAGRPTSALVEEVSTLVGGLRDASEGRSEKQVWAGHDLRPYGTESRARTLRA